MFFLILNPETKLFFNEGRENTKIIVNIAITRDDINIFLFFMFAMTRNIIPLPRPKYAERFIVKINASIVNMDGIMKIYFLFIDKPKKRKIKGNNIAAVIREFE